jgi:hypothetical protein
MGLMAKFCVFQTLWYFVKDLVVHGRLRFQIRKFHNRLREKQFSGSFVFLERLRCRRKQTLNSSVHAATETANRQPFEWEAGPFEGGHLNCHYCHHAVRSKDDLCRMKLVVASLALAHHII